MQSVSLADKVSIEKYDVITVDCSDKSLCGRDNLAYRAAELFFTEAGIKGGAKIHIEKHIPVAAGLAGGSADAAAVICGLNALFDTRFSTEKLCFVGAAAGADVPFCIKGGTMLARGIGEKLEPVPCLPDCFIVTAKNGEKSSTGALYALYDKKGVSYKPDTGAMKAALLSGSLETVGRGLCNVFEELVPQSTALKRTMFEHGALGAALSGSGPSVFGIFRDAAAAENCAKDIGSAAFLCTPAHCGCVVSCK